MSHSCFSSSTSRETGGARVRKDRLARFPGWFSRERVFSRADADVSDRDAQPPHPSREAPGLGSAPTPARREVAREATPLAGPPGRPRVPESSRAPNQPS